MAGKALTYHDGETTAELGDRVEVGIDSLMYEPEMAVVKCLGRKKIMVEYDNETVKPRVEWVLPDGCEMISRAG